MTAFRRPTSGALPCVDDRRPVAVAAKHLCGVASDLAVNAVMSSTLGGSDSVLPPAGVAIATCCHQLYVVPTVVCFDVVTKEQ